MESFELLLFHHLHRGFNEVERECKMESLMLIEAKHGGGGVVQKDS